LKPPVEILFAMRVLFFAQLKDATGCDSIELAPPAPLNYGQLWIILIKKFPALANHQKTVRLARNWEYTDAKTVFADEDEIALIPPVSGG
jgi:molybdopterin converting factor subunit 1